MPEPPRPSGFRGTDPPLEETGFELFVPLGISASPSWWSRARSPPGAPERSFSVAEPIVRIHLPPALSQQRTVHSSGANGCWSMPRAGTRDCRQNFQNQRWCTHLRRPSHQGLTNFSTNSSFGCGGSGVFLSLGSLGLRRNLPSSTSLKPAASTSWRRKLSSIRCKVPDSDMPVPGRRYQGRKQRCP